MDRPRHTRSCIGGERHRWCYVGQNAVIEYKEMRDDRLHTQKPQSRCGNRGHNDVVRRCRNAAPHEDADNSGHYERKRSVRLCGPNQVTGRIVPKTSELGGCRCYYIGNFETNPSERHHAHYNADSSRRCTNGKSVFRTISQTV